MLNAIRIIAERQITAAIQQGNLKNEHWRGKPLPLENDQLIPPDLRMAYKILKNSGYLPPEVETRKEIYQLEELIAKTDPEHERLKQLKKLHFLIMKLDGMRGSETSLETQEHYHRRIVEKLSVHK